MRTADRTLFPAEPVVLRHGQQAVVRLLQREDARMLGDFYASLPEIAARFYWPHPLTRENGEKWAAEQADSPCNVTLVLETPGGEIAGYAWYQWPGEEARASVFGICIREDYQSSGAGRVLMERLLGIAQTVGPPIMQLTCQHANVRAVALYRKMGFEVTKEGMVSARRQFPAEPQYWMERPCR